jgi:PhnB protein
MATKKKATAPKKAKKKVNPIPRGYRTVTPTLNQADASATIAFCKKAFGAKVLSKMSGPGGKIMHAELQIVDSLIMVSDAMQEAPRVGSLFLYVPNVDKTIAKAVKAGASVNMPAQDMFWGDRFGRIADPQGNLWGIATHIENVPPVELKKRSKAFAKQMAAGGS